MELRKISQRCSNEELTIFAELDDVHGAAFLFALPSQVSADLLRRSPLTMRSQTTKPESLVGHLLFVLRVVRVLVRVRVAYSAADVLLENLQREKTKLSVLTWSMYQNSGNYYF